jgi:hypothetical protein
VTVDVIKCASCLQRLERTAAMVKRNTRTHKGSCAAYATRERMDAEGRLAGHMRMMREASRKARDTRLRKRLADIAPEVPLPLAVELYERGYKAGHQAKHRRQRAERFGLSSENSFRGCERD